MTDSPSIPAQPAAFRPVDWRTFWLWIAVCAASPVCLAFAGMAFNKQINPADPYASPIRAGVFIVIFLGLLTPPVLYWLALRRIAPRLSFGFWVCGLLFVGVGWLLFASYDPRGGPAALDYFFRAQPEFNVAVMRAKLGGLSFAHMLGLPWDRLLLTAAVTGVLVSLIPAWMVSSVSHRRLYPFLLAAAFGACAAAIAAQYFSIFGYSRVLSLVGQLNGRPWIDRINELMLMAAVGAVWGAASGFAFVLMSRPSRITTGDANPPAIRGLRGTVAMALAILLIPALAAFASYLIGPQGLRAGAPGLRKLFTLAPSRERSEGEAILTYAHDAAVAPNSRSTGVIFAPDGKTAVVLSADFVLTRIDLTTGASVGRIGEPLDPLERHAGVWSPDGSLFLLRSNGAQVKIAGTRYTRHQSRVRAFALPDYQLVDEFPGQPDCLESHSREALMFEPDGKSVWLACAPFYAPKNDDIAAIRLDVPSLRLRELRRHGDGASSGAIGGLEQVGDAVWAWQQSHGDARFRVLDLTNDRQVLLLPDIRTPELAGDLTAQTGATRIDDKRATLVYCGNRPGAANVPPATPAAVNSFCRTLRFDTQTGTLLETSDSSDWRFAPSRSTLDAGHGLRIEALWQNDSKTGEIVVRDAATGRQRQRLVSVSQRPLRLSPDGRWLVTYAFDRQRLRIYRVAR